MIHPARIYAMEQANKLIKLTMQEFFIYVHANYYSDQDISFMKYFLDLTKHSGEFVVPHTKLLEFGIMSSTRSGDVLTKLNQLDLENEVDYLLRDISQQSETSRGAKYSKQYMLTPEAFKLSLMSAKRYPGQTVNPLVYRKYYLLLEVAFKLYTDYEREYSKCLVATKDAKIDSLEQKMDRMLANSEHIISQNSNLITQVSHLNDKIDAMFEFMLSFARMTIPTWIGSSVIKQQYDTLATNKTSKYALDHLKVMYMVGFHIKEARPLYRTKTIGEDTIRFPGRGRMIVYACCTNFSDISARLKLLYTRHASDDVPEDERMCMMRPKIITLISCEINSERIILENATGIFPEQSIATWDGKYKSFELIIDTKHYSKARLIFNDFCKKAVDLRFQDYQQRIDQFGQTTEVKVDSKIISYIDKVDHEFFSSTRPFAQKFIDRYVSKSSHGVTGTTLTYAYIVPSRSREIRDDLNGANLTTNAYALQKIKGLLFEHTSKDHIEYMTTNGLLSKDDLPALRAIAEYENIDVSALEAEYSNELDEY